ncbi:hypothetical protein AB7828_04975 [Tardiphaga sp. 215_C5_N2_1]
MTAEMARKFWAQHLAEIQRFAVTNDRAGYDQLLQRFLLKQR